jgi:hypothetical protein
MSEIRNIDRSAVTNILLLPGYGPFSLWVIHKKGLCPNSRDINRMMIMMIRRTGYKPPRGPSAG